MKTIPLTAGSALAAALAACGPPSAPPVGIATQVQAASGNGAPAFIADATPPHLYTVGFSLLDASSQPTVVPGSLLVEVRDRPLADVQGRGTPVCSGRAEVTAANFDESSKWAARVSVRLEPACPPWPPDTRRGAYFTFTPTGGAALPIAAVGIGSSRAPSIGPPRAPAVPTPPPPAVAPEPPPVAEAQEVDGWIVVPALGARVRAPGARVVRAREQPVGASDVHIIGASDDCRVQLGRWPTMAVTGASTRSRVVADGNTLTVDEVTPQRWHLEYEANSFLYVSVGVTTGDTGIVCRADYPSGQEENRACAARICATLEVR